jgi:hypothetical protein
MKEEALKLADELEGYYWESEDEELTPSKLIRRLVEELGKQGEPFGYLCDWGDDSYGLTRQTFYYGERGSPTLDDWNEYPKVHHNLPLYTTPQTKPLSDEEITQVFDKCYPNNGDGDVVTLVDFARAIEERHGIK